MKAQLSSNKIICMAKNYSTHAKEMGANSMSKEPVIFSKPFSSIVTEPNSIKLLNNKHIIEHECITFNYHSGTRNSNRQDS